MTFGPAQEELCWARLGIATPASLNHVLSLGLVTCAWGHGEEAMGLATGQHELCCLSNPDRPQRQLTLPPLQSCLPTATPRFQNTSLSRLPPAHNPRWLPSSLRTRS